MRVLLIEDDMATAQGIELMLKSEGFNVYTTDLGEEGVDLGKLYRSSFCPVHPTLIVKFAASAPALMTL